MSDSLFHTIAQRYAGMPRTTRLPSAFTMERLRKMPTDLEPLLQGSPWQTHIPEHAAVYEGVMRRLVLGRADQQWAENASLQWRSPEGVNSLLNLFGGINQNTNMIRYGVFPLLFNHSQYHILGKVEVFGAEHVPEFGEKAVFAFTDNEVEGTDFDWPKPIGTPVGAFIELTFHGPQIYSVKPLIERFDENGLALFIEMSIYALERHMGARIHPLSETDSLDPNTGSIFAYLSSSQRLREIMERPV